MRTNCTLVLTALALAACVSCSQSPADKLLAEASERAKDHLVSLSQPNTKDDALWGMTDVQVFGVEVGLFGDQSFFPAGLAAGDHSAWVKTASAGTFGVTLPFWCQGTLPSGDRVNRAGSLTVSLKRNDIGWEIVESKFGPWAPVSGARQFFGWLGSFVIVMLIFFFVFRFWWFLNYGLVRFGSLVCLSYCALALGQQMYGSTVARVFCCLGGILLARLAIVYGRTKTA